MHYLTTSIHANTCPTFSQPQEQFITWLLFTIVLAVLPLVLDLIVLLLFATWQVSYTHYLNLLKDGQLFFFSTTLSASSLNKINVLSDPLVKITTTTAPCPDPLPNIQAGLWMILILSLFTFGLSTYFNLAEQYAGGTISASRKRIWGVALGSIFCAIGAGFLSYQVYVYGGA